MPTPDDLEGRVIAEAVQTESGLRITCTDGSWLAVTQAGGETEYSYAVSVPEEE